MPPDTSPPDDERGPDRETGNVVDPTVLAERRAQRAEQSEQSAARRAADAQVLAAQLARERARLEAERDAARAEAAAAREGADAAIAEAGHLQAERDQLREALAEAQRQRKAQAPPGNGSTGNGHAPAPPATWGATLRRELAAARSVVATPATVPAPAAPREPVPALERERRLVTQRASAGPAVSGTAPPQPRRSDRAAPVTALALERERSSRLQAQLDHSLAVQQELRLQLAGLERAVSERVDAEQRIEAAMRRVREELTAANAFSAAEAAAAAPIVSEVAPDPAPADDASPAAGPSADRDTPRAADPSAVPPPAAGAPPVPAPAPAPPAVAPAGGLDPLRLSAARERLQAVRPEAPKLAALPGGPVAPWLTTALRRLLDSEPQTAGRIALGILPAQALPAERPLRYDVQVEGRATAAVDVRPGAATVRVRTAMRERGATDLRIAASDHAGLARLLYARRGLRRPARVRGSRRALRELRRLARAAYGIRDLADTGVTLDPLLALRLVALAIDPAATSGERFAIAHRPLAGGPVDAWLRIADGAPPAVFDCAPPEPVRLTLRCTRGALLALVAGVASPRGESGTVEGDESVLALLRSWIAQTERPAT